VAVISKGDEALLNLDGRKAWHFPQDEQGSYLGYHPPDGAAAIAHLEQLRERGADYLVLPSTAFWWLEYYPELNEHLRDNFRLVTGQEHCLIFGLTDRPDGQALPRSRASRLSYDVMTPLKEVADSLLPPEAAAAILMVDDGYTVPDGYRAWQFPRAPRGDFSLLGHLDALETSGVEFLIVPRPEAEWLKRHPDLASRLRERHRLVIHQDYFGDIYELGLGPSPIELAAEAAEAVPAASAEPQPDGESAQPEKAAGERPETEAERSSLVGRVVTLLRGSSDGNRR